MEGVTVLDVQTGVCPPVLIEPTGTTCLGDDVTLTVPQFTNNPLAESLANYSWTGPEEFTGATASAFIANAALSNAGLYTLEVTFTGLECLLSSAAYTLDASESESRSHGDPDAKLEKPLLCLCVFTLQVTTWTD